MARRIAIIGGGAAGIYAALAARKAGADATIYERNARLGIKILISGGGKCNITHDVPPAEMESGFLGAEGRFLRYALHELPAHAVIKDLHEQGVPTYTRPNGRVFPVSGRADDVLSAFERMLYTAGVEVRTNARVTGLHVVIGTIAGIRLGDVVEQCDAAIVATGGMSYRKVGTTGDGISWMGELGHTIDPVRAALAPIYFNTPPPVGWPGVALRDVVFWIEIDGRKPKRSGRAPMHVEWRDDVLLTHRGMSGPAVLEVSRAAAVATEHTDEVALIVDLVPDVSTDELLERWNERLATAGRALVRTFVDTFLPRALAPYLLQSVDIPVDVNMSEVTRQQRTSLLATVKHWKLGVVGEVPIDRGEVTAGGVALSEVSPQTMESKRVPGLYVAGEALDIAGSVGGYNLQAAFATGFVAGRSAAGS